jgi:hypothetical protein
VAWVHRRPCSQGHCSGGGVPIASVPASFLFFLSLLFWVYGAFEPTTEYAVPAIRK